MPTHPRPLPGHGHCLFSPEGGSSPSRTADQALVEGKVRLGEGCGFRRDLWRPCPLPHCRDLGRNWGSRGAPTEPDSRQGQWQCRAPRPYLRCLCLQRVLGTLGRRRNKMRFSPGQLWFTPSSKSPESEAREKLAWGGSGSHCKLSSPASPSGGHHTTESSEKCQPHIPGLLLSCAIPALASSAQRLSGEVCELKYGHYSGP